MKGPVERKDVVPGTSRRTKGSCKQARDLIKVIERLGAVVKPHCSLTGHWKVYLDGRYIGGLAGTPSDRRAWANDIARLRRGGLAIDTKGRPL